MNLKKYIFTILFFTLSLNLIAQNTAAFELKIDSLVLKYKENHNINGITVGVVKNDYLLTKTYGFSNQIKQIAVTDSTTFEIGSVTKVFTGLLIYDLFLQHKISLENKVGDYFDGFRPSVSNITVRELLTHTSGLKANPNNLKFTKGDPTKNYKKEDFIAYLKSIKKLKKKEYRYSNSGVILLGLIIEKVTKKTVKENYEALFHRLNLKNTDCLNFNSAKNLSKGYSKKGKNVANWEFNAFLATGGIHSNSTDLNKLMLFYLSNDNSELKNYYTPLLEDKKGNIVSYLIHIKKINKDIFAYWHNGNTTGFYSYLIFIPKLNLGVNVICNSETKVDELAIDILNLTIKKPLE